MSPKTENILIMAGIATIVWGILYSTVLGDYVGNAFDKAAAVIPGAAGTPQN